MGEKLQNLKPREAKGLLHAQPREAESLLRGLRGPPREAKPFTRMAKWEIRFQRFALSFRPSALGHCCFRFPLAFSLQPLAFARALYADLPRRNSVKTGVPMAGRRREPLTFLGGANEKFHISPTFDGQRLGRPTGICQPMPLTQAFTLDRICPTPCDTILR